MLRTTDLKIDLGNLESHLAIFGKYAYLSMHAKPYGRLSFFL